VSCACCCADDGLGRPGRGGSLLAGEGMPYPIGRPVHFASLTDGVLMVVM